MKRIMLSLIVALAALGAQVVSAREVKVMTYNVHNGVGLDKMRDHKRIAGVMKAWQPDFVAVQEVDSATARSGRAFVLGEIAAHAGMVPVFAPAIEFDGGRYGIGLLSKNAPDSVSRIPLPGREESRMLLIAWFPDVVIADTHLSLTPEDALASVGIIRDALKSAGRPVILMGDLNSLPASPAIRELVQDFMIVSPDAPTFPANAPTERIDYIMVSRNTPCIVPEAAVIEEPSASDHRPVGAVIVF